MRLKFLFVALLFFGMLTAQHKPGSKSKKKEPELTDKSRGRNLFKDHSPNARDFHSIGHSLFFDLNLSPIRAYAPDTVNTLDTTIKFSRIAEYSFYHISYFFRYNVVQPSDEKAFTITLNPGLGLGLSQSKRIKGFGAFSGAVLLGYEWGNGATYRSEADKGAFIRLGAEYSYTPLLVSSRSSGENEIKAWISPVISFGFRKENDKENLIESNFKIGWGFPKVNEQNAVSPYTFARPFSFRFSFVVFLDH